MRKLFILILISIFVVTGCKYFSKGTTELAKTNAKLESALKAEKAAHEKDIEQLKLESQAKLDSLKTNCDKQLNRYHIIVGAFKVPGNADGYLKQMTAKGYPAQILPLRSFQMVSVNSFSSLKDAVIQLGNFRNEVTQDAWIYVR